MAGLPWEMYGMADPDAQGTPPPSGDGSGAAGTPPTQGGTAAGALPFAAYGMADPDAPADEFGRTTLDQKAEQDVIDRVADPDNPTFDWFSQVGRAFSFGAVDLWTAKRVKDELDQKYPHLNMSYEEVLRLTRGILDKEQSTSADIAGTLLGAVATGGAGAAVAKGAIRGGAAVAGRMGMESAAATAIAAGAGSTGGTAVSSARVAAAVARQGQAVEGAMRGIASSPALARFGVVAAEAGAGGAVYEATRQAVSEAVDVAAGGEVDSTRIVEAAITGGIIGALLGPPAAYGMVKAGGAIRGMYRWVGAVTGSSRAQTAVAGDRLARIVQRQYGGTPESAFDELQQAAQDFARRKGRPPLLSEILHSEVVNDVVETVGKYSGLGLGLREAAEAQISRVQGEMFALTNSLRQGAPMSERQVYAAADRWFGGVTRKYGSTMLDIGDEAVESLGRNAEWLASEASAGNRAAASVKGVLDARSTIGSAQNKVRSLTEKATADDISEVAAEMRMDLATLIRQAETSGQVPLSESAELASASRFLSAVARHVDAGNRARNTVESLGAARAALQGLSDTLTAYERSGLKVSLTDVDMLRQTASRAAYATINPTERTMWRGVRGTLEGIGEQVPEYGEAVRGYHAAMTIREAMPAGKAAIRGTESAADLRAWLGAGYAPTGKITTPVGRSAARRGAEEGLFNEIDTAAGKLPTDAYGVARAARVKGVREGIRAVLPADKADTVIENLSSTATSLENLSLLTRAAGQGALSSEQEAAREVASIAFAGTMGGAGRASLASALWTRFRIPRGAARKLADMMVDPKQLDKALAYVGRRGIDMNGFVGAMMAEATRGILWE